MKIPERVRIAGVEYEVRTEDNLREGGQLLYGKIDFDNCLIFLSDTDGLGWERKCVTLLHEILHGIIWHYIGEDITEEEKLVVALSKGLYQVLQDNGGRLYDISYPCNERKIGKVALE